MNFFGKISVMLAGLILYAIHTDTALADLEVIESNTNKYSVGTRFSETNVLNIFENKQINQWQDKVIRVLPPISKDLYSINILFILSSLK